MSIVVKNYDKVMSSIKAACKLHSTKVDLIAISKYHSQEAVIGLIKHNHFTFGENKVQEASTKFTSLKEHYPELQLHLVGPLQTNKVKDAVRLFDFIHSLDRVSLAKKLAKEMIKQNCYPKCFIQVNIGNEPQKSGVSVQNVANFAKECIDTYHLPVVGLMCIPPVGKPAEMYFEAMRSLQAELGLMCLSMGMSSDFEYAIEHGSTHVRVGTAIFGAREYA